MFRRNIQRRQRGRQEGGPVGTEALALSNIESNAKQFGYPPEGFVTPIEHSLLYAIISEAGTTYPKDVIERQIVEEDFKSYMLVNTPGSSTYTEDDPKISYAQLSAILGLSAVKLPPPPDDDDTSNKNDVHQKEESTVGQKLCKALLKCVIRHAERHNLDREAEVQEFLRPVQIYTLKRENKAALVHILPMYLGYAATLVTANPVPMLLGASVALSMKDKSAKERDHVKAYSSESNRRSDVEKASLLDEGEDFDDYDHDD
jgi:hypothetical protein